MTLAADMPGCPLAGSICWRHPYLARWIHTRLVLSTRIGSLCTAALAFNEALKLLHAAQLFEWYNLDAPAVIDVCQAYKPKPRAPKMLARTGNRQGTVSVDTTLQVGRRSRGREGGGGHWRRPVKAARRQRWVWLGWHLVPPTD